MSASPLSFTEVVCPHCLGRSGSCHVCLGARRVLERVAERAVRAVWGRPRCCDACRRAGPAPAAAPPMGRHDITGFIGGGELGDY